MDELGQVIDKVLVIPEGTTEIKHSSYENREDFERILFPESLTTIDQFAFKDCTELITLMLPNALLSVGYEAFRGCLSLRKVTILGENTNIKSDVFNACEEMEELVIIGDGVRFTHFVHLYKPDWFVHAFSDCDKLKKVSISAAAWHLNFGGWEERGKLHPQCFGGLSEYDMHLLELRIRVDHLNTKREQLTQNEDYNPDAPKVSLKVIDREYSLVQHMEMTIQNNAPRTKITGIEMDVPLCVRDIDYSWAHRNIAQQGETQVVFRGKGQYMHNTSFSIKKNGISVSTFAIAHRPEGFESQPQKTAFYVLRARVAYVLSRGAQDQKFSDWSPYYVCNIEAGVSFVPDPYIGEYAEPPSDFDVAFYNAAAEKLLRLGRPTGSFFEEMQRVFNQED